MPKSRASISLPEPARILLAASGAILALALGGALQPASAVECGNVGAGGDTASDNGLASNTACGDQSDADGVDTTAYGAFSEADGTNSTAVGNDAEALVDDSTALGADANAIGVDSTAVGFDADAFALLSTAVGAESEAVADSSVALGALSRAEREGAVSVGNSELGIQRQITNVAPGTIGTDAVNWGQLAVALDAIEDLKAEIEALKEHTHTYLTGRGQGHNNTEAETGDPLLPVEQPDDMDGAASADDLCPGTPEGAEIDASGCDLTGFCAIQGSGLPWPEAKRECKAADWFDDESGKPRDCRWRRGACEAG